jgi:Tetratricopeptide repeat
MGQYDRALPLYESAFDIFEQLLGHEHPNTKVVQGNLRMARQSVFTAQENAILQALPLLEKSLGSTHPITQAKRQELNQLREKMKN